MCAWRLDSLMYLFGILYLSLLVFGTVAGQFSARPSNVSEYDVVLDRWYDGSVSRFRSVRFVFDYTLPQNVTRALRLQVSSNNATITNPIHIVIRERKKTTSWEIPYYLRKAYPYWAVRRTLCPVNDYLDYVLGAVEVAEKQRIYIEIFTHSKTLVGYQFNIWFVPGFIMELGKTIDFRVSPSAPAFFQYTIPSTMERVMVRAFSPMDSMICSYLSIQPPFCPIADLPHEVTAQGAHQTFTTQGSIVVRREDFQDGKFDIVLVPMSDDHRCKRIQELVPQLQKDHVDIEIAIERNLSGDWDDMSLFSSRAKHVYLSIEGLISFKQFLLATLSVLAFYASFYIIFRIAMCYGFLTKRAVMRAEKHEMDSVPERKDSVSPEERDRTASTKTVEADDVEADRKDIGVDGYVKVPVAMLTEGQVNGLSKEKEHHDGANPEHVPLDEDSVENRLMKDAEQNQADGVTVTSLNETIGSMEAYRAAVASKAVVCVTETSLKSAIQIRKRDRAYNWTLFIIAVFYSLPVVQLVLTYQRVMESTGNMDICYYNFRCAYPLGKLNDFNHIYSNIGYVLLGLLFILIVWKRHKAHLRFDKELLEEEEDCPMGLPPQYGLFYAMGISLVMEGVMSASYHVCPNYTNFQFDTSFMYLLGGLFLLKMYQARHADISPHAQVAYAAFAFWIFLAVLGVVIDKQWFWTAFAVVLCVLSVPVGIQIYYMGSWRFDLGMFARAYEFCKDLRGNCMRPTAPDRLLLLVLIYAVNWIMAIGGAIFIPSDFSTFLLGIVLANAFCYFLFYIVMKVRSGERLTKMALMFILMATASWGGAIYFFMFRLTNWVETPAHSREGNKHCFLLDFFDEHDFWHMLSSCSMFFNFMVLFTLDDDLFAVPRHEIRVF